MEIYLIRHTTPLIEKGLIYGRTDVALADSFLEEKENVITALPAAVDAIYSSPSSRCTLLASAILAYYGEKQPGDHTAKPGFFTNKGLYELNFGDWEGESWDTVDRAASEAWMSDFVHLSPPNGETMLEMERRIVDFWDKLMQQPYRNVCIVTHGGVIRILLARYRSIPLKDAFSIQVGMAEVFKLMVSSPSPGFDHQP